MKKILLSLTVMLTTTLSISGMSLSQSRTESLFLTDKMAYELQLSASQYDAVYEINLDYFLSLRSSSDIYGSGWTRRDIDLGYVLNNWQYNRYRSIDYFYRPVYWNSGWRYSIYSIYTNRSHFYYGRPTVYSTYKGAHNWRNNGNKSWYKGRTFDNSHKLTVIHKPSGSHPGSNRPGNSDNWRTTNKKPDNNVRPNGGRHDSAPKVTTNRGGSRDNTPKVTTNRGGSNDNTPKVTTNRGGTFGGKRK